MIKDSHFNPLIDRFYSLSIDSKLVGTQLSFKQDNYVFFMENPNIFNVSKGGKLIFILHKEEIQQQFKKRKFTEIEDVLLAGISIWLLKS